MSSAVANQYFRFAFLERSSPAVIVFDLVTPNDVLLWHGVDHGKVLLESLEIFLGCSLAAICDLNQIIAWCIHIVVAIIAYVVRLGIAVAFSSIGVIVIVIVIWILFLILLLLLLLLTRPRTWALEMPRTL